MSALLDWPGQHSAPRSLVFLASEARPPPCVEALLQAERAERQREELNTLYVAMTRARRCLMLSCVQDAKSEAGSWWNRLPPSEEIPFAVGETGDGGSRQEAETAVAVEQTAPCILPALPAVETQLSALHTTPTDVFSSTAAARQGEAMHQLLEQAGAAGASLSALATQGWPAARLARLARDFELSPQAAARAAAAAQRILQGEGAWAWDTAQVERSINEAALTWQGNSLRIDRLVQRKAQGWWVLDYKSAARPEQQPLLRAQLQQYREAVRALLPGEQVMAAFLTGEGRMVLLEDVVQGELF